MYTAFYHTSLLVEAALAEDSLKACTQGTAVHRTLLLILRDRLALRAGQLLIASGRKLTALSTKRVHLAEDAA
jgi:hypothetical protein